MGPKVLKGLPPRLHDRSFLFAPVPYRHPLVRIKGGAFTHELHGAPLWKDLEVTLGHPRREIWAVVGPSGAGKTTFLELLRGRHASTPHDARTWPALSALAELRQQLSSWRQSRPEDPRPLIEYVSPAPRDGLLGGAAAKGAYLSARYESGREASDLTLQDYLTGNVHLNPDVSERQHIDELASSYFYQTLLPKFSLDKLVKQPMSTLSNGQTRRARIARALVPRPGMLLLDEPFVGLDPLNQEALARVCQPLSEESSLGIVVALEDTEPIPQFVTHMIYLNTKHEIQAIGERAEVDEKLKAQGYRLELGERVKLSKTGRRITDPAFSTHWWRQEDALAFQPTSAPLPVPGDAESVTEPTPAAAMPAAAEDPPPVVELLGVQVRYGETVALGAGQQIIDGTLQPPGLWWRVRRGERWGVFGANGAGKTTLLSLVNSDHPQAYSQPVRLFGRSRLPSASQPGLSIFDLQARIGQASPEIHNFFPRHLSVRQALESAWAETFLSPPKMTYADDLTVDATLRWFQPSLDPHAAPGTTAVDKLRSRIDVREYLTADVEWADGVHFRDLAFAQQRVLLFLRAVIRKPDLVILDEAFGGMSATQRIRCLTWLAYGERRRLGLTWKPKPSRAASASAAARAASDDDAAPDAPRPPTHPADRHVPEVKRPSPLHVASQLDPRTTQSGDPDAVRVDGLEPRQTLLCVAHRREDVPPILDRWILLPPDGGRAAEARKVATEEETIEAGDGERDTRASAVNAPRDGDAAATGVAPSFGRFAFRGFEWHDGPWWREIWWGKEKKKKKGLGR